MSNTGPAPQQAPFRTLPEMLDHVRRSFDNPAALSYPEGEGWKRYSTREVAETVRHLALGLHALGLRRGQTVGLISPTSPHWVMIDLAILCAGGVTVPVFKRISPSSLRFESSDSAMKIIFVGHPNEWQRVMHHCRGVTDVVAVDFHPEERSRGRLVELLAGRKVRVLADLLRAGRELEARQPELFEELWRQAGEEELATIIYTSGSTGRPKGVRLSHRNLVSQMLAAAQVYPMEADDVALSSLPMAHVFERTVMYCHLHRNVPVYIVDELENVGRLIRDVRPTIMTVVPRLLEKVYERMQAGVEETGGLKRRLGLAAFRRARSRRPGAPATPLDLLFDRLVYARLRESLGGRFRYIISGAAPLDPELARFFVNVGVPVYEGYGLTEAAPVLAANRRGKRRIGTVGQAFPGVELRIAPDSEILARGPNIMMGYHNDERATAAALDPEGWLHTGDLGRLDEEGYLTILGRKKELFKKSTGEYVAPAPIEQALCHLDLIDEALVVADRRKFVTSLLFLDPGKLPEYKKKLGVEQLNDEEFLRSRELRELLQKHVDRVNRRLHHTEEIQKFAMVGEELSVDGGTLTPTLKVRREAVEEKYASLIEALYRE